MSTTTTPDQGLEKAAARTPDVITTPDEYRGALLRWQSQQYHVLTPFTNISGLAPSHGIITSLVHLNPNKEAGEVYDGLPFLKRDEVAPAKTGLRKLAECAGISTRTERTDPRTIPFYWEFKAIATYRGVDGATIVREATKEWDLRDGAAQLKGWTPNQIEEGRKHGLRNCEARAINAAIRECGCGVRQKYTREDLKKPFVVMRVMFLPDMSDPEIKRLVTERALGGTSALYSPPMGELPPASPLTEDNPGAARPVGQGSTVAATPSEAGHTAETTSDPDQPPTKDAVRIEDVKRTHGQRKDKTSWTRFAVVDSNGEECSTFDTPLGEAAEKAKETRQWVELGVERQGEYRTLVELVPAGQHPPLPGMENL